MKTFCKHSPDSGCPPTLLQHKQKPGHMEKIRSCGSTNFGSLLSPGLPKLALTSAIHSQFVLPARMAPCLRHRASHALFGSISISLRACGSYQGIVNSHHFLVIDPTPMSIQYGSNKTGDKSYLSSELLMTVISTSLSSPPLPKSIPLKSMAPPKAPTDIRPGTPY